MLLVRTDSVNPHHDERSAEEANEERVADLMESELAAMSLESTRLFAVNLIRAESLGECNEA